MRNPSNFSRILPHTDSKKPSLQLTIIFYNKKTIYFFTYINLYKKRVRPRSIFLYHYPVQRAKKRFIFYLYLHRILPFTDGKKKSLHQSSFYVHRRRYIAKKRIRTTFILYAHYPIQNLRKQVRTRSMFSCISYKVKNRYINYITPYRLQKTTF